MTNYENEIDFESYLPLVKKMASRMFQMLPDTFEFDDIYQTGMVALVECVHAYSFESGVPVEAYISSTVKRRLIDWVRGQGVQPRTYAEFSKSLSSAQVKLIGSLGRRPTDKELSVELGIGVADLHSHYCDANWMSFSSLEDSYDHDNLITSDLASDALFKEEQLKILGSSIENLSEQEKLVLSLYYNEELNLREIKAVLDLSEARIHQIKGGALLKLKGFMLNENN